MATIKSIGSQIAIERKKAGYTQEELALEADIDRSYVSDIENGKANFSIAMMLSICAVININPKRLFD